MSIFDGINIAEQAMGVHRLRSEITAENLANAYTPGYHRKIVELQANTFSDAMNRASGANGTTGGGQGAVRVTAVRTDPNATNADNQRQQALQGVIEMMQSKGAFELNMRAATMLKSMALSSLEIGRG